MTENIFWLKDYTIMRALVGPEYALEKEHYEGLMEYWNKNKNYMPHPSVLDAVHHQQPYAFYEGCAKNLWQEDFTPECVDKVRQIVNFMRSAEAPFADEVLATMDELEMQSHPLRSLAWVMSERAADAQKVADLSITEALEVDDGDEPYGGVLEGLRSIQERAYKTLKHETVTNEELEVSEMAHTTLVTNTLIMDAEHNDRVYRAGLTALGREGVQLMKEFNHKATVLEAKIKNFQKAIKANETLLQSLKEIDKD